MNNLLLNESKIKKLLHHREPYLLIEEVELLSKNEAVAKKTLNLDKDLFLKGHFPDAPVLPGALMHEMLTQTAGVLMTHFYSPVNHYDSEITKGYAIGVLVKTYGAKFLTFARANDKLNIHVKLESSENNYFIFNGHIKRDETQIMKAKFALTIISDNHLYS